MSGLGTEKRVTDLNSAAAFSRISVHELRTLHSLPGSRPGPPSDARPYSKAIRAHYLCPPFRIPTATHLHGFCADDFQGWVARHRDLPQRKDRDALSSWIHRTGCKIHTRRCQRNERLADLGGPRQEFDEEGQTALCGRGSWLGFEQHDLCARLHDDRLVADAFSMGRFPSNQGGHQASYSNRSARADSDLHLHYWCAAARCGLARQSVFRSRSLLSDGSWLHGFQPTHPDSQRGSFFRDSCKKQPPSSLGITRSPWIVSPACAAIMLENPH